jgi:dihydrolipoamide dehydrogenase
VVIATGSRPLIPGAFRTLGERLLTSESLFDLEHLPGSVAVIGLGAIGLELGQALHRLGVTVTGFDARQTVAGLTDPEVSAVAVGALEREFPIHLGAAADFAVDGSGVLVTTGNTTVTADRLLLAVGRVPNVPEGLSRHCRTDPRGVPEHDPETFRVGDLPVFIAGDATGDRMLLQDAADEGRAAGANAVREEPRAYPRKTPMDIVFADPNIAVVGAQREQVRAAIVGQQRFGPVGRALIMGRNRGLIRLYADRDTGRLLGAAMVGPRVEHLAHLVAWSVQQGHTVEHMLGMPFYHPVIEEALQDALKDTARRLAATPPARAA